MIFKNRSGRNTSKNYEKYKYDSPSNSLVIRVPGVAGTRIPTRKKVAGQDTKHPYDVYETDANGNELENKIENEKNRNGFYNILFDHYDYGLLNPNLLFDLRNEYTYAFDVHELFPEVTDNNIPEVTDNNN
ncbi:UNVERIFIED_CONTAM: hypothetical protein O8I53_09410 [Campylobacter lari]